MNELDKYRKEIDEIDNQIIHLFNERFLVTDKVGIYKKKNNLDILNSKRENEIFTKIKKLSKEDNINDIIVIYELIMKLSKDRQ